MNGRHFGARLHDYTLQGYRTIALENEVLRVEVLADKGSDIVGFLHKPSDTDFMWHREVGLQPAGLGAEPRGADEFVFVDQYEGGWQECLPNGGAERPLQGRPAALPRRAAHAALRRGGARGPTGGGLRPPERAHPAHAARAREDAHAARRARPSWRSTSGSRTSPTRSWTSCGATTPPSARPSSTTAAASTCRACRGSTERAEPWPGSRPRLGAAVRLAGGPARRRRRARPQRGPRREHPDSRLGQALRLRGGLVRHHQPAAAASASACAGTPRTSGTSGSGTSSAACRAIPGGA